MRADTAVYTAFEEFTARDTASAEKVLMWAILRTAMEDIRKTGEPFRQARQYFLSNDDKYLFAFLSICNHLEICPHTLRARLGLSRNGYTRPAIGERIAA